MHKAFQYHRQWCQPCSNAECKLRDKHGKLLQIAEEHIPGGSTALNCSVPQPQLPPMSSSHYLHLTPLSQVTHPPPDPLPQPPSTPTNPLDPPFSAPILPLRPSPGPQDPASSPPFPEPTEAYVARAIAKLKGHKAPRHDNTLPEMLKYGGPAVAEALHGIILEAWWLEHAPPDFKRDPVIPRRQTMMTASFTGRWHFNLLQLKCMPWCCGNDYPCGLNSKFWSPNMASDLAQDVLDALFSLRSVCSLAWNKNKTLYICMLDLAKALDSADRDLAWRILLTQGAPPKLALVALLKDLHTDLCGTVRAGRDSADSHIYRQGVQTRVCQRPRVI